MKKTPYILSKAIAQLPIHKPEELVWDNIAASLDKIQTNTLPIHQLKEFQAPDFIWDNIETQLTKPARTSIRWIKLLPYAAAISGLIWFSFFFFSNKKADTLAFQYSTEKLSSTALFDIDWTEDEAAFSMVENLCETYTFACENAEIQFLRTELIELTSAKEQIKSNFSSYQNDPSLVKRLSQIERQRSDLLKQFIAKI